MIHVIAVITAHPGKREDVLAAFRRNRPNVLAEEGCLEYFPVVDADGAGATQTPIGPDSFMVIERWASMAALQAHAVAPHMAAYGAAVRPLVKSRAIHVLAAAA
jgi:quinol monooxygenase YgiN